MQFKEQFRKHSNWTITAMTAGAITVVAATGLALADNGNSRESLEDQINLLDRTPISQGRAFQSVDETASVIPAPIVQVGDVSNSYDSPLDAATTSVQSVVSVTSVESVASPESLASYDSPDAPAPAPAQAPVDEASWDSPAADSYDSPS